MVQFKRCDKRDIYEIITRIGYYYAKTHNYKKAFDKLFTVEGDCLNNNNEIDTLITDIESLN